MDASGKTRVNQCRTTKVESAAMATQTAMKSQSERVKRIMVRQTAQGAGGGAQVVVVAKAPSAPRALHAAPSCSRQLLQGLFHPLHALGRVLHREVQRRTEAHRVVARSEHH